MSDLTALPKPQNPLDWATQLWNIVYGSAVQRANDEWLVGPIGSVGGISDRYVLTLAQQENLKICRNVPSTGLMSDFDGFNFSSVKVNARIRDFYLYTLDYSLDVWTQWEPVFGSFGFLVKALFASRIEQLNLPQKSLDTAYGLRSEIISLQDADGRTKYRIWFRRLKRTGEVVYSGVYTHCVLPSGEKCLKIVFPLPQGSATVIMRLNALEDGSLVLESRGRKSGEPGFYFLVEDCGEKLWKHYLPSFHEKIHVYEDDERVLRADHTMELWGYRAYQLHYKIVRKSELIGREGCSTVR